MANLDIDVDLLAPIIFLKNLNNLPIVLKITDSLENNKDIFFFCLDLFFKGLFMMNSIDEKTVILNNLNLEEIYKVVRKMRNANLNVIIEICDNSLHDQKNNYKIMNDSLALLKKMPNDKELKEYSLRLLFNDSECKITFSLS
jgi:hypothetical protein